VHQAPKYLSAGDIIRLYWHTLPRKYSPPSSCSRPAARLEAVPKVLGVRLSTLPLATTDRRDLRGAFLPVLPSALGPVPLLRAEPGPRALTPEEARGDLPRDAGCFVFSAAVRH